MLEDLVPTGGRDPIHRPHPHSPVASVQFPFQLSAAAVSSLAPPLTATASSLSPASCLHRCPLSQPSATVASSPPLAAAAVAPPPPPPSTRSLPSRSQLLSPRSPQFPFQLARRSGLPLALRSRLPHALLLRAVALLPRPHPLHTLPPPRSTATAAAAPAGSPSPPPPPPSPSQPFTAAEADQPASLLYRQAARPRRGGWRRGRRRRQGEWRIQTLLHADANPTGGQTLLAPHTPTHRPRRRRVSTVATPGYPATITPTPTRRPAAVTTPSHSISVEVPPLAGLQCRVASGQQSSSSMAACKIWFEGVEARVVGRQLLLVQL
ncbi:hypothetical protein GQ55_3G465500 [Panicum hallii var. hallii]|uniref:Uncharacterized protein n=1 Tax=Panicum hallii var. hallii TaxID=1504633 RepID=A0A2T7EJ37_9POAL|nr:hypothetical protein GQ55_3G465500 [Panicum hallii var. hallii]